MKLHNKTAIVAILLLMVTFFTGANAKNKCVPKLYAFGFAASFNDSIAHFTNIQELDSAWINDKNKFLIGREDYSYQLRNYLEGQGMPHRTCVICYDLKQKKAQKKFNKMRDKYVKQGSTDIRIITNDEFTFTVIKPEE